MRGLILVFLLLASLLKAQNDNIFYANASSLEVVEGTNFEVDFILNNAKGTITPPDFSNFTVISGPRNTSSYSNINGKVTQQYSYSYVLSAPKSGTYRIEPAYCEINGQKIFTQPLIITVVKRDKKSLQALGLPSDEDIFVRLELSKDTAYMGEKVELVYRLYTRKEVRSYDIKNEADYTGFYVRPHRESNNKASRVEIDGKAYSTQILEKRLLFPQQTGLFEFDAANVTLGLPDPNRRGNGFFFNSNNTPFPVITNAAKLLVINLPEGAPDSFSGAIGKYRMTASIDKQKLTTDDALTLTMTVTGNGDAKYILPAAQNHLTNFEVYDPNTIERGEREMFGEIQTVKDFEYLIVPLKAGRQSFQAEYTYFDTERNDYVTLKSKVFPLMVEQGTSKRSVKLSDSDDGARTLSGLMEGGRLKKKSTGVFNGWLHWTFLGMSMFAIGFIFWKKRLVDFEANIDPSIKKRNKAKSVAEKRLEHALQLKEESNHRAFYEEISRSIFGFIADKLNVPNSEISKSNVASKLGAKGVSEEKVQEVTSILSQCEMAVFAGKKDGDLTEIYNTTRNLIEHLSDKI